MTDADSRPLLTVLLVALIGMVDAVAFLSLGGFFAASLGANATRLAAGVGGSVADASLAARLILAFVAGVMAAQMLGCFAGARRTMRILALAAALILACALVAKPYQASQILLLAGAVGALHCVAARDAEGAVGVLAWVLHLARAAADRLMGDPGEAGWRIAAILLTGFVAGGLIGVGTYARIGLGALHVAGLAAAALALWQWWSLRRTARPAARAAAEQQGDAEQDRDQR